MAQVMGNARYVVLSVRVSLQEEAALRLAMEQTQQDKSSFMRAALERQIREVNHGEQ